MVAPNIRRRRALAAAAGKNEAVQPPVQVAPRNEANAEQAAEPTAAPKKVAATSTKSVKKSSSRKG